jgi:hypothetical protein
MADVAEEGSLPESGPKVVPAPGVELRGVWSFEADMMDIALKRG